MNDSYQYNSNLYSKFKNTYDNLNEWIRSQDNFSWEYSFIISFIIGIIFSGISYGIVYVIIFLIVSEFLYYVYLDCNNLIYTRERILVCLGGILGYMLGASFLHDCDDYALQVWNFPSELTNFARKCGLFDNEEYMKYLEKCKEKECPYHYVVHEKSRKRDHLNCKKKCVLPPQCHIYRGENCKFYIDNKQD